MTNQSEVDRIAGELIAMHGSRAAIVATERLNDCIDLGDLLGRDHWAQVVHRIHCLQASAGIGNPQ